MIIIRISNISREFEKARDIDENWIMEQLNRRRLAGNEICVRVSIKEDLLNLSLSSHGCNGGGGGGRPPNEQEDTVFDLWDKVGMNKADFSGGALIAFFKQIHRIIK